jgi:hypothetical protein
VERGGLIGGRHIILGLNAPDSMQTCGETNGKNAPSARTSHRCRNRKKHIHSHWPKDDECGTNDDGGRRPAASRLVRDLDRPV